jgi:hypothetical protein
VRELEGHSEKRRIPQDEPATNYLERRQHPRYSVDGVAEVLVADGTMLFRGRVLDISLSGCYIETPARLRLAPGTRVEMVFRVNGMVFRPMATSRMVKSGEGAGFLFLNLHPRMEAELEDLIAELSFPGQ